MVLYFKCCKAPKCQTKREVAIFYHLIPFPVALSNILHDIGERIKIIIIIYQYFKYISGREHLHYYSLRFACCTPLWSCMVKLL